MNRRELIALVGGAVATGCPQVGHAQRIAQVPTLGWVVGAPTMAEIAGPDPANLPARAFVHALRDLGWIDGRSINIERRSAEGRPERAREILAEKRHTTSPNSSSFWNTPKARLAKACRLKSGLRTKASLLIWARKLATTSVAAS